MFGPLQPAAEPVGHGQVPVDLEAQRPVGLGELGQGLAGERFDPVGVAAPPGQLGAGQRDRGGQVGDPAGGAADRRRVRLLAAGRQRRLGPVEQRLGLVHAAREQLPHRLGEQQPRPGADQLRRQGRQPPVDRRPLGPAQQGVELPLDQPRRPDLVPGGQGMADGLVDQPVVLAPGRGRAAQPARRLRVGLQQPGPEQVGEQLVVAPPAPDLVQGDQEQIGPLQPLQPPLAAAAAADGVAQRPRQPLQHRGLEQEPHRLGGLAVQHLLGQVVQDIAVAARELLHEPGDIRLAP